MITCTCQTRISSNNESKFYMKFPVLLGNSSLFTKLIILQYHEALYHYSVESSFNRIRNIYWIIPGKKQEVDIK